MKKLGYKEDCWTCAYELRKQEYDPCLSCLEGLGHARYRPKWWLRLFGRAVTVLLVTVLIFSICTCVARAATLDPAEPDKTQPMVIQVSDTEIDMLARLVYSEARGVKSTMEQAAVIWCALNRIDNGAWGDTITSVVTWPHQFAYDRSAPIIDELRELAADVVQRWIAEKRGVANVGRVLPAEYLYFAGHRGHNRFRLEYDGNGEYWDWSLPDPYAKEG